LEDVIYFDPSYTARPMGLNMLEYDVRFPEQKTFVVNEMMSIFNKLFDMKKIGLTLGLTFLLLSAQAQKKNFNLLVGTYTNKCDSKGIYVYDFNANTADFKLKNTTNDVVNPSYLTVSNENDFVYSVNENGKESTVSAFTYSPKTGNIDFINKEFSQGADPCFIINDSKNIIVANYSGGNIVVFGKNKDGSITAAKQVINHKGSSINAKRQENPHAHMVHFSPDKKYVLSNDLGTDKIHIYKYNANSPDNILSASDSVAVKAGSGPRHLTFSKNGKYIPKIEYNRVATKIPCSIKELLRGS
jgi:6-phosphogluconolactonase